MNKTLFKPILQITLFFSISLAYAQNAKEGDQQLLVTDQDKFITLSQTSDVLSKLNNKSSVPDRMNTVFIRQVGVDNVVLSNIIAESSDIKIIQNGDQNKIEINEAARTVDKIISQNGANNSVIDFSFNPNISTNLELIQEGNNLNFERFGSNELSKNLKFRMTGDTKTIVVRSF